MIADKGCSSRANRDHPDPTRIKATIPEKDDQIANRLRRGSAGGRPTGSAHKRRNVVERCFNRLKTYHGIANRYDHLARNYPGALNLISLLDWRTDPADTPSGAQRSLKRSTGAKSCP
ncbi:transposase [Saccharothrix obliqua]|uniref:transposase n=1 Tax=Saccharothrix obliqua TaxID=2861747 RepID=UPI001C603339|nr:transposase [Saccharothrix obliqua]MBW4717295.1 transposase [Saccharothrix obliqua]